MGKSKTVQSEFSVRVDSVTKSAFLVPEELFDFFKTLQRRKGSVSAVLEYLLRRYRRKWIGKKSLVSGKIKTSFQARGLDLQRVSFVPSNESWVLLSLIAVGLGHSRTKVFSMMLEWESQRSLEGSTETSTQNQEDFSTTLLFSPSKDYTYTRKLKRYRT